MGGGGHAMGGGSRSAGDTAREGDAGGGAREKTFSVARSRFFCSALFSTTNLRFL
jgi:hypothetical protein